MALARPRAMNPFPRLLVIAVIVAAFVPAVVVADSSSARTGYRFLQDGPARAPDAIYLPVYAPGPTYEAVGLRPSGMSMTWDRRGVVIELRSVTGSDDGELLIWESTRSDATVEGAVGRYAEDGRLAGTLADWQSGRTADGRQLIYARIGPTLVVIVGSISLDELLRIADSLRKTTPQSLML
jgi:hypothetical protein